MHELQGYPALLTGGFQTGVHEPIAHNAVFKGGIGHFFSGVGFPVQGVIERLHGIRKRVHPAGGVSGWQMNVGVYLGQSRVPVHIDALVAPLPLAYP